MTLDASRLQISVQEQERWRRRMSVTVPASIVQDEERKAARQLASRARVKGFRKGRVPTRVIESRYRGALRREALDKLIGSAYREALASQDLRPISEGEIEDVQYKPEADLTFAITFDVEPVFEVERLGGFAIERSTQPVADEQVDAALKRIQEQNGVWQPIEEGTPADSDLVSVEITRLDGDEPADDGREYDFIIGQGDAIPDIENAIKTLEPGGAGAFDVTFPDDFPDEDRRGESERIRIGLKGRRTLDVPELNDDLARQVGDFDTLEELRSKVRKDMEQEASRQADAVVRGRLLDLLLDANPFDVPASMVERYSDGIIGDPKGIPDDKLTELREQLRPEAERAVKRILMVERIGETQSLAASEDDLDHRIEEIAEANNTDAAKVYAELQKAGRLEAMERELTENAVFEFLMEQSEITEASSS
jgi:trigger factor